MIRPYVTLSAAMSIDGHLDGLGPERLTLSNAADLDRVDAVRAAHDAIMVGASTVRRDDPRLLVKSPARRARRERAGMTPSPLRVTVTSSGALSPDAALFTTGGAGRVVYAPHDRATGLRERLGGRADVVGMPDPVGMGDVLRDLAGGRGVARLMVEGGGTLLTQFLAEDLADELQLVIAPILVGEDAAPRLVGAGRFPWTAARRADLAETRRIGDVVLLRYALSPRFGEPVRAAEPLLVQGAR